MRKVNLNTVSIIVICILAGAMIFFAFQYTHKSDIFSSTRSTTPNETASWIRNDLPWTNCSATRYLPANQQYSQSGLENVFLQAPSMQQLVVENTQTGARNVQQNLEWFCPIKFYGSILYGKDRVAGYGLLYAATIQSGVVTTTSLGAPAHGIISPDGNYFAFSTDDLEGGMNGTLYCGLIAGATTNSIRILDFNTGEIITVLEDGTDALELIGWSSDGKNIKYNKMTHPPVSGTQCTEDFQSVHSDVVDVSTLLQK